ARILWPALGFPAVIAPQKDGSTDAGAGNPSRCICALILSDKQYLGKEDLARYLRIVPWDQRARRYIASGQPGSFNWTDIQVRNDDRGKNLLWPKSDRLATAEAAMDLLNDLKAGGYKIVFMQPKYSVTTIASYDEAILKQLKGPMTDTRPTSSVVRTISE